MAGDEVEEDFFTVRFQVFSHEGNFRNAALWYFEYVSVNESDVFDETVVDAWYFIEIEYLAFLSPEIDLNGVGALYFSYHA